MSLKDELSQTKATKGTVQTWWLGGTGFIFKTAAETQVYIDPYLSNIAADIFNLERGFPPPIDPKDAHPDLIIATHTHEDHLDPVALPIIARNSNTHFICPGSCKARLTGWGVLPARIDTITPGETLTFKDVTITATAARHPVDVPGWEVPDAVGVILEIDGVRIYHSGDTEYDLRLRQLKLENLDAAMLTINGGGGNMNAHEAALLAWWIDVPLIIPMHHILWKEFGGVIDDIGVTLDPQLLASTYNKLGGSGQVHPMQVGENITLTKTRTS